MINKHGLNILCLIVAAGLLIAPQQCAVCVHESLRLCFNAVIPALFPFFVCVKIMLVTGLAERLGEKFSGIMQAVFRLPGAGAFAFVMGILSGYPVGAKCAGELYRRGACSLEEGERISCFCNNSGPMFVIGSVGTVMLKSYAAGVILYISHVAAAITVGIILGRKKSTVPVFVPKKNSGSSGIGVISDAVGEAVSLILYICGFILFFNVVVGVLNALGIIPLICSVLRLAGADGFIVGSVITAFIEMTNGISGLVLSSVPFKLPVISFVLGFGGISVILQVAGVAESYGFSTPRLIAAKLIQGAFSALYTVILLLIPISDGITAAVQPPAAIRFQSALAYGITQLAVAVAIMFLLSAVCRFVSIFRNNKKQDNY